MENAHDSRRSADREAASRNTDVEVLRAVAIGFTLICHLVWSALPALGPFGRRVHDRFEFWTGVDLFFCISGFIITTSLLKLRREKASAENHERPWRQFLVFAVPFWIRRAFRLLPCAWLWIVITLVLAATFNGYDSFGPLRENLNEAVAAVLNVANFYYYEWFARAHTHYGSFGVFWSLALEEQFYLLFPFLLFFAERRILVTALLIAFFAQVFMNRPNAFTPDHPTLLWFVRTDALILGVLIACWKQRTSYRRTEPTFLRRPWIALPLVVGVSLLLAAVPAIHSVAQVSTGVAAVLSGLLVWMASYDRDYIFPEGRIKSALVWLGTRSYGIYLIHITGRALILELKRSAGVEEGSAGAIMGSVLSVVAILLLAELNYRFIETPARRIGRRLANAVKRRLQIEPVIKPQAGLAK